MRKRVCGGSVKDCGVEGELASKPTVCYEDEVHPEIERRGASAEGGRRQLRAEGVCRRAVGRLGRDELHDVLEERVVPGAAARVRVIYMRTALICRGALTAQGCVRCWSRAT